MMTAVTAFAAQTPPPQIHRIANGAGSLHVIRYPADGRETVILLHGGPGLPGDLSAVASQLAAHYQVIIFHQRGTALSPCPEGDYSLQAYVSDINTIAHYFELEKFHLFGHSWGGLYAQVYAEKHPDRLLSLFLCCPGSGTGAQWDQTEKEVMQLNRRKCTTWQWTKMGVNNLLGILGSDRAYQRLFRQVMSNYNRDFESSTGTVVDFSYVTAPPINHTRKAILQYPLLQGLANPSFPITIVYGDQDIYQSSKNFVLGRYPTARVHTIVNCGHIPWLHNPDAYRAVLGGHFSEVTGKRKGESGK